MAKSGLGKGLESLIPLSLKNPATGENSRGLDMIPLEKLTANPNQPRKVFEEEALEELAETIKKQGVLQPVLVEKSGDGNYILIAGERRMRAARLAGLKEIPAIVRRFTPEESLVVSLIENIQRTELNPIEEAAAYKRLIDLTGLTQDAAAERLGKNRATFVNTLRLLKLPPEMQDALRDGTISAGHARALLSLNDSALRETLFNELKRGILSVRETERRALELSGRSPVRAVDDEEMAVITPDELAGLFQTDYKAAPENTELEAVPAPAPHGKRDPEFDAIEEKFRQALGTKVKLEGNFSGGSLKIDYYSMEDLDRLYNIITK